jgi:ketosteroid isomerase-like protein
MTNEEEVRKASERFYAALNRLLNGDAGPMTDIWSHSAAVTTMHPISGREVGWDQVRETWEKVAQVATDGKVGLKDQLTQIAGDVAYELGIEHGQFKLAGHQITVERERVTNIYRREAGAWKIVHHHSDLSPTMVDVLSRLQTKAA